jgi:hypothetical protein
MIKLVTLSDFEGLKKGDKIHVSNGQPEPPKHYTKKHSLWACDNYTGFFNSLERCSDRHEIKVAPKLGGRLVYAYGVNNKTFSFVEEVSA